jgi:hypothetical protein
VSSGNIIPGFEGGFGDGAKEEESNGIPGIDDMAGNQSSQQSVNQQQNQYHRKTPYTRPVNPQFQDQWNNRGYSEDYNQQNNQYRQQNQWNNNRRW